jgi:hydrogenase maturation protein HypF
MRLDQAGLSGWADALFAGKPLAALRRAVAAGVNAPPSSSAGRLFDAVAAVLGLCADAQTFEGEAAMRLEARAAGAGQAVDLPVRDDAIDPGPLFHAVGEGLRAGTDPGALAMMAHVTLAQAFATAARGLVKRGAAQAVALSGGCIQNALLLDETLRRLGDVPVLVHRTTPANDGGLALGQAAVAAARAIGAAESI